MMMANRYCYKCRDCIAVFFVEQNADFARAVPAIECTCGGTAELMGRVQRQAILKEEYLCPCDGRCTGALGPNCDCQCGGANHGSGALVPVLTDVSWKLPKALNQPNLQNAQEYRLALSDAKERMAAFYGESYRKFRAGEYISDSDIYWKIRKDLKAIHEAQEGKTHKGRMKKLLQVATAK